MVPARAPDLSPKSSTFPVEFWTQDRPDNANGDPKVPVVMWLPVWLPSRTG
jgi:hypothetical protein